MKASHFDLLGVDGSRYSPVTARRDKGLLVMFICNHCPYVKRVIDGIVRDCTALAPLGIGSIAVMSNDPSDYPEDSFDNMKRVARDKRFPFPYVLDETQDVARAYGTVCTPEFFGFDAGLDLQYHGRFDELFEAMKQIAGTGKGPKKQVASVGCSIKWRKG
ncbi:MAG TPA: thioredoxin family protein [Burkholderiales bacterium]|nr:thioredoxin family protein [Burkholderiales bacterium]